MAPFLTCIIMLETTVASFTDEHSHQTIKPPHHPVKPSTGVFQLYQDGDNLKDWTNATKILGGRGGRSSRRSPTLPVPAPSLGFSM